MTYDPPRRRKRRKTLRDEQQIRIVNNDPDYERISAEREAKGRRFTAKVLTWIAMLFLIPTAPFIVGHPDLGLPFGIGVIFGLVAIGYLLSALSIEARFH